MLARRKRFLTSRLQAQVQSPTVILTPITEFYLSILHVWYVEHASKQATCIQLGGVWIYEAAGRPQPLTTHARRTIVSLLARTWGDMTHLRSRVCQQRLCACRLCCCNVCDVCAACVESAHECWCARVCVFMCVCACVRVCVCACVRVYTWHSIVW
jgi:hypothetical protein